MVFKSSRYFDEIVEQGEAYFRAKHPNIPFHEKQLDLLAKSNKQEQPKQDHNQNNTESYTNDQLHHDRILTYVQG